MYKENGEKRKANPLACGITPPNLPCEGRNKPLPWNGTLLTLKGTEALSGDNINLYFSLLTTVQHSWIRRGLQSSIAGDPKPARRQAGVGGLKSPLEGDLEGKKLKNLRQ
ncbi:MAG: hypothetical protein CO170_01665 [candidate division SR1 bacterium CG_4_9_14_3_um_filter_40_9]|nr:MAG: hypothetical protein CO170_01665 [candidate division SR1 bacterium CG_4_9_14_3_um_filter_40_9]